MDQISIGKFIAQERKRKTLTQEQLGEILGVTNKTVSRWETGTYMPPADILLKMSELFGVSVNEILSGKRLSAEEYRNAAERNLTQTLRESSFSYKDKMEFFKKKWLKEHIAVMILAGICILAVLAAGICTKDPVLTAVSPVLLLAAHCVRNNAMMAYAENRAFEENG